MATALGVVGGALAFGADWGTEKIPVGPWPQAAILGGGGLVLSVGLAKWLSIPLGAGVAGGAAASVGRRIRDILTVGAAAEVPLSPAAAALIAGRESGWSAASMMGNPLMGDRQSFRRAVEAGAIVPAIRRPAEAGASRYIPGPVSSYGPNSWVYGGAGVVKRYVSSHNR